MVEENTTTCACQGGWMCPNCADQHRAEISRLKAELSEAKSIINDLTGRHGMQTGDMSGNSFEWRTKYTIIERQLADLKERYECKADALGAALLTIDEYEKQLAEAKASAQAWHDNCNIMEAELDKERNKHAETVGKLSEARAEVAEFKATIQPGCCGIATCPGVAEARQEAAREILEWAAGPESYDEWVVMVRERYGLEGLGMSKLNDDMWEQIELNNYGKGKLVHIVNEQAELIRSLYEQLDSARREGWEQAKRGAADKADNLFKYESGYYHYREDVGDAIAAMEYKERTNG